MKLLILCALVAAVTAIPSPSNEQEYKRQSRQIFAQQYRPEVQKYRPVVPNQQYRVYNDGSQYRSQGEDDGQYHPDNSGAYHHDDSGAYRSDGSQGYYQERVVRPVVPVQTVRTYQPFQPVQPKIQTRLLVDKVQYKNQYSDNGRYNIIRKSEEILEDGYHYIYETENGILVEEEGHLVEKGTENEHMSVRGYYAYPGPDNVPYRVDYTSDGITGFVPAGAHLPVAPDSNDQQRVAVNKN